MMKLICAIVGDKDTFSVDIHADDLVADLKKSVKDAKPNGLKDIDADKLKLFLAKTGDGKWLPDDNELGNMLKNKLDVSDEKQLRGAWKLDKEELFGPNVSLEEDVVHVAVVAQKQETQVFSGFRPNADGLNLMMPHIPRNELVQKLYDKVLNSTIVLLSSPAGSGKTSLLTLFSRQYHDFCYIPIAFHFATIEPTVLLKSNGVDLVERKYHLPDDKTRIFLLDNCHKTFGDDVFWEKLLKDNSWIPKHVRFILSSTQQQEEGYPVMPVVLDSVMDKLTRDDFLISDAEAHQCLRMGNGLPTEFLHFSTLLEAIVRECNGHIGSLRVSIDRIYDEFKSKTCPTEDDIITYFFSGDFVRSMSRCFGGKPTNPDHQAFLAKCLVSDPTHHPTIQQLNHDELVCFTMLQKSGIVTDVGGYVKFTSPIAERYYYQWLFPNRARKNPKSLDELIRKAIGGMSAHALKQSVVPNGDFPKEAVFQHLFMATLAQNTTHECFVCPELSRTFPDSPEQPSTPIAGEIDFYLNGNLKWGIELLVNGRDISEHLSRFGPTGKYSALQAKHHVVVDFRGSTTGNVTGVSRKPERVSVFFELGGDFSSCYCIFGQRSDQELIQLAR